MVQGAPVKVEILASIREWKDFFLGAAVPRIAGGMRDDATGMRTWIFIKRKDLPHGIHPEPITGAHGPDHPDDVCLMVKRFLWQATLAQRPMVVLPASAVRRFQGVPATVLPPKDSKRPEEWRTYARELMALFPNDEHYQHAARYLCAIAAGQRGYGPLPHLPWYDELLSAARRSTVRPPHTPIVLNDFVQPARVRIFVR